MRTTLEIEDDILQAAKEIARREGTTAGRIISALARHGLATRSGHRTKRVAPRGGVPVLPTRGEVITIEHIEKLISEESI